MARKRSREEADLAEDGDAYLLQDPTTNGGGLMQLQVWLKMACIDFSCR